MNLLRRILLAPAVAVFCMLVLGYVSYQSLGTLRQATDELANTRAEHFRMASELKAGVLDIQARSYRSLIWADKIDANRLEGDAKTLAVDAEKIHAAFDKWVADPDLLDVEKMQGKQILEVLAKYKKAVLMALELASVDINTGVSGMQSADDMFQKLSAMTAELVRTEERLNRSAFERAASSYDTGILVSVAALLAALILSIGISVVLARGIVERVLQATQLAGRIAAGDLTMQIKRNNQHDEVGVLLDALQCMQESLRDVIGQIAGSADELSGAVTGMTSAADGIRHASLAQSDSVSSTAAAVEELTVSIAHVAENVVSARGVAEQTANIADSGKTLVDRAACEIGKIAVSVSTTSTAIHELQASSQQISRIANAIREIAERTNLLALNAAIEAARAGEQGRGFAVVADEVRKLAERTGAATNEIKDMTNAIQAQTSRTVMQMSLASEQVSAGVTMIQDLQAPLEELKHCSAEALASLVDLSAAANEQSHASTQIARNIESIARMGEGNHAAASNSHTLAQGLSGLSQVLQVLVSRFKR